MAIACSREAGLGPPARVGCRQLLGTTRSYSMQSRYESDEGKDTCSKGVKSDNCATHRCSGLAAMPYTWRG